MSIIVPLFLQECRHGGGGSDVADVRLERCLEGTRDLAAQGEAERSAGEFLPVIGQQEAQSLDGPDAEQDFSSAVSHALAAKDATLIRCEGEPPRRQLFPAVWAGDEFRLITEENQHAHLEPSYDRERIGQLGEQSEALEQEVVKRRLRILVGGRSIGQVGEVTGPACSPGFPAQSSERLHQLRLCHDIEFAPAGEQDLGPNEEVEMAGQATLRPAYSFGDDPEFSCFRSEERQDPVGLAEVAAAQDDRLGAVQPDAVVRRLGHASLADHDAGTPISG
jgi:hypothetical protein